MSTIQPKTREGIFDGRAAGFVSSVTCQALLFPSTNSKAAPSQNVLGSFFPTWMICFLGAVVATILVRGALRATGVGKSLPAPVLVTIALLVTFTLGGWLLWVD